MTQYDAGPGDWSDREWDDPERKQKPQAKRRFALPPWALITALVAVVILLCVGLIFGVRALGQKGKQANATPTAAATAELEADVTATPEGLVEPQSGIVITSTLEPVAPVTLITSTATVAPGAFTQIAPGATVVVKGTGAKHLNIRAQPTTGASGTIVTRVADGTELLVVDGPQTADGYTWWQVRTADQKTTGWAAETFLALKP